MRRALIALTCFLLLGLAAAAALHVTLASLTRARLAETFGQRGDMAWLAHDGIEIDAFVSSVRVIEPRLRVRGRAEPIAAANGLWGQRHSSLLRWLRAGAFDLELQLNDLRHDLGWLEANNAPPGQIALAQRLGLDQGVTAVRLRMAYAPARGQFSSELRYGGRNGEPVTAALNATVEGVSGESFEALSERRMPTVRVSRLATDYSSDKLRELVGELAGNARLSESTLLRLLAVPVPCTLVAARVEQQAGLTFERLHVAPLASRLEVTGLGVNAGPMPARVRIGKLTLAGVSLPRSPGGPILRGLRFEAEGLVSPLPNWPQPLRGLLGAAGYTQPSLDVRGRYRFRPEADTATLGPLSVRARHMGVLRGRLNLSDVSVDPVAAGGRSALLGASVAGAALSYRDSGLRERLLATAASRRGVPQARYRSLLRGRVAGYLRQGLGDGASRLAPAVDAFLNGAHGLRVRAEPGAPVAVRVLAAAALSGNLGGSIGQLGLRARALESP